MVISLCQLVGNEGRGGNRSKFLSPVKLPAQFYTPQNFSHFKSAMDKLEYLKRTSKPFEFSLAYAGKTAASLSVHLLRLPRRNTQKLFYNRLFL